VRCYAYTRSIARPLCDSKSYLFLRTLIIYFCQSIIPELQIPQFRITVLRKRIRDCNPQYFQWQTILILVLINNSQSSSWSIAWMGRWRFSRWLCGRRQPGQLRLERCCGWLWQTVPHMGRKRVPVSYGSNRKRVAECLCLRANSTKFKLMFRPGFVIRCSGWIPTWPMTTLYSKANLRSLRRLCKVCQPSSCNICVTLEVAQ